MFLLSFQVLDERPHDIGTEVAGDDLPSTTTCGIPQHSPLLA